MMLRQRGGIAQAVLHRDAIVLGRIPEEGGRRRVAHQTVAGEALDLRIRQRQMIQQTFKAAHMRNRRVGGDHGIAQDGRLYGLALRQHLAHLRPVEGVRIQRGQMTAGGEAENRHMALVAIPRLCVAVNQLDRSRDLAQSLRKTFRCDGIPQNKDVIPLLEVLQRDRLCLAL